MRLVPRDTPEERSRHGERGTAPRESGIDHPHTRLIDGGGGE